MRNSLDFGSWSALASTLVGLVLVSLVAVGVRLVFMQFVQRRRERENRQINERLKTLIAAYKTLGGSFTGRLAVDPAHLRDLRVRPRAESSGLASDANDLGSAGSAGSEDRPGGEVVADNGADAERASSEAAQERRRRIRDAVEAALSDIILLGTEEQVRMAAEAAREMVQGRAVHVGPLVTSLRNFIRQALDLDPIAEDVLIPEQGPVRPASGANSRRASAGRGDGEGRSGARAGGGGGGGGAGGGGGGMGLGMGVGAVGAHRAAGADSEPPDGS